MADARHLAIVLPGQLYTAAGPALLVPVLALRQLGAEVVEVEYPKADDETAFHAAVADQVRAALGNGDRGRLTFVAKSLGTMALPRLDQSIELPADTRAIWVTPVFDRPAVRDGAIELGLLSLVIAGSADSVHDPAAEARVGTCVVIEGADHSLVVQGDVVATVDGWRKMADAVLAFAAR